MNIALILQLVQFGAQFLQTTHAISPTATTTSLADLASAILRAQNPDPVKWLQSALNATIGANLDVDGDFGQMTEGAVQQLLSRFLASQDERATILAAIKILLSRV
jgi:lysozyme family protein